MEEDGFNQGYGGTSSGVKITDIEARQRLLKERMLLIGSNLVDIKEGIGNELIEIKKELHQMKSDVEKVKSAIEILSKERENYARKTEINVLKKQAQMFRPLELATKDYVDKKLGRHKES